MIATVAIRPLREADIPALVGVLMRAYDSQQHFEFRLAAYLRARHIATFVADLAGEPVGMVVGNDYGSSAYVSQMAVDPVHHRRGIGTALMDALVAWADAREFAAIELDATPAGAPLYARYGFVEDGRTLVFGSSARGGDPRAVRAYEPADFAALCAIDARAFGADRSEVLGLLVAASFNAVFVSGTGGTVNGYAVAQPRPQLIGPVIATHPDVASRLIDAARTRIAGEHRISIPSTNVPGRTIVTDRGYVFSRPLAHMIRGQRLQAERDMIFGRINLGQG